MKNNAMIAIRLTMVCLVFFCGVYTMTVWAIAQLAPNNGKGFTITQNGKVYHELVAQNFTDDKYFWSRPSAVVYNAAGSGGSNKSIGNPDYLKEVQSRIDTFLVHNPDVKKSDIPSELVTASGSGLDPHLSKQGAIIQVKRIAKARNMDLTTINKIIDEVTEKPLLGLFGTERVNVLQLNLALDKIN